MSKAKKRFHKAKNIPGVTARERSITAINLNSNLRKDLCIIIGVLAFLLYANTLNHGYVLDDYPVIKGNVVTQQGIEGIPILLRTAYWYGMDGNNDWLYRPLSMVMFALEWEFFPNDPAPGHWINVLMYAFSCVLMFVVLCKLLAGQNVLIPFITTLLFVVHPIHTEVVANIKSRDELLAMLLFLGTVYYLLEYVKSGKISGLIFAGFFYFLALFSKETAITFLAIFPIILFFFTEAPIKKIGISLGVFLLLAAIFIVIRGNVLTSQMAGTNIHLADNSLMATNDMSLRFATAFSILGRYIGLLLFPISMACDYSFSHISIIGWTDPLAIGSFLIYAGLGIYAVIRFIKKDVIAFGILFYLIPLSLVANIFFFTRSTMADRFLYFSSMGFCLVMAVLISRLTKAETIKENFLNVKGLIRNNFKFFLFTGLILAIFSLRTHSRNKDWKSDTTLFTSDRKIVPNSARIQFLFANHYLQSLKQNIVEEKNKESWINESINGFNEAIRILPTYMDAYIGLGEAYSWKLDYPHSIENYRKALKLNPGFADALNNLGNAFIKMQQYDSAMVYLKRAVEVNPKYANGYSNMGMIYFSRGEFNEAIGLYNKAIELNPLFFDAYKNLGSSYGMIKEFDKAITIFHKALELSPDNPEICHYLGMTYQFKGNTAKSEEFFARAKQVNPNN